MPKRETRIQNLESFVMSKQDSNPGKVYFTHILEAIQATDVKDIDFIINEKAVVWDDFEGAIRIAECRAGGAEGRRGGCKGDTAYEYPSVTLDKLTGHSELYHLQGRSLLLGERWRASKCEVLAQLGEAERA
jgi:hypothetical protein